MRCGFESALSSGTKLSEMAVDGVDGLTFEFMKKTLPF